MLHSINSYSVPALRREGLIIRHKFLRPTPLSRYLVINYLEGKKSFVRSSDGLGYIRENTIYIMKLRIIAGPAGAI